MNAAGSGDGFIWDVYVSSGHAPAHRGCWEPDPRFSAVVQLAGHGSSFEEDELDDIDLGDIDDSQSDATSCEGLLAIHDSSSEDDLEDAAEPAWTDTLD